MQRDEAQQLLELCRPGNEADRRDPALAKAFAMLETDAELRAWFEAQQAADARISASLNSLEAPADLKASILAGMHLHRAQGESSTRCSATGGDQEAECPPGTTDPARSSAPFRASPSDKAAADAAPQAEGLALAQRSWWRNPWIGIAAALAIALLILNVSRPSPSATDQTMLAGLPPVIQYLSGEIDALKSWQFDKRDENPEALKAYLASAQLPSPGSLPDCLAKMESIGCITFEYENAKLSMICFKNGDVYHLITADKATYPDALPMEPAYFQTRDKAFRLWVDGEQVKIITVHGTKEDIPEII